MEKAQPNQSSDTKNTKPLVIPNATAAGNQPVEMGLSPNLASGPKKWSPGSWQDANRKSAFLPYKPLHCTVLTNLQRGNTQAETPVPQASDFSFHSRAGQGEITDVDIKCQVAIDATDSNGLSALHWAAAYGQLTSVELLVAYGAAIDKLGPEGETPLLLAANGGHHDVVRFLLNNGADVNHTDHVSIHYNGAGNGRS